MTKASGISPVIFNQKIPQGATFIERYFFTDTEENPMPHLDTATGLCQVRELPADESGTSVIATATVTITAATGEIEVLYPVTETLKLTGASGGCGYYRDIKIIYDDNSEDCIVSGRVTAIPEVSR